MAETTTLREGGQTLIYFAPTEPTDETDNGDAAYELVGLQIGHDKQSQANTLDGRNKRVGVQKAGSSNVGSVTLTASSATTTVSDLRAGQDSVILFMPRTANAAAAIGGLYVSARGKQTFTLTHANNAQTDRTFSYVVLG